MLFRHLSQILAVIGTASAIPKPVQLNFDDILLLNADGSSTVMKEQEYTQLVAREALLEGPAQSPEPATRSVPSSRNHRRCEESNEVQVTSNTTFLNWDVPMSPVLSAAGGGATVSVASGYSIANSVMATAGMDLTLIEKVLSVSMSLSYTETWTTTDTSTFLYTIPAGQYGLIVSQPKVRRVEGNYLSGCVDSPSKTPFTSDTYKSQSYGNLQWVQGIIRLCNSTTYPVPYCIGDGSHS